MLIALCNVNVCVCVCVCAAQVFEGRISDRFVISLLSLSRTDVVINLASSARTLIDTRMTCSGSPTNEAMNVTDLVIVPSVITFPAGTNTPVEVLVSGFDDGVSEGTHTASITLSSSSAGYNPPRAHVCDTQGPHSHKVAMFQQMTIPGLTTADATGARGWFLGTLYSAYLT